MKKLLLFVLIALLSLSLFSCGDGDDGTSGAMPTRFITGISGDVDTINLVTGETETFILYLEDANEDPDSVLDSSTMELLSNDCIEINRDIFYDTDDYLEICYVVTALRPGVCDVVIKSPFNDVSYSLQVVVSAPEHINAGLTFGENVFNGLAGATYTFTAPTDGTLTLTGFTPDIGSAYYYYSINGTNYLLNPDSQTDIELFAGDVIVVLCEGDENANCNCYLLASWNSSTADPGSGDPDNGESGDPSEPEEIYSIGLSYELSENGEYYIVTGRGTCTDTNLIIPSKYNGLPVKEIADRAFYTPVSEENQHNTDITESVTIPASVKRIGMMAFYYSSTLNEVVIYVENGTFPVDGGDAFVACQADRYAYRTIDSVTFVGDFEVLNNRSTWPAVYMYSSDQFGAVNVTFDGKIGVIESVYPCKNLTVTGGVDTVKQYVFSEISNGCYIQNINFNGIKTIEKEAFSGNKYIRSFNFEGLTSLGESAFEESSLGVANIPGTLTHIPTKAFYNSSLGSLTLGEGVISIGKAAFMWCDFGRVDFGTTLTSVGPNAFYDSGIGGTLIIPANLTSIGSSAFGGNQGISSLVMLAPNDNKIRYLGASAFYGCDYMTDVSAEGLTNYDIGVFERCYQLKRINFGVINVIHSSVLTGLYHYQLESITMLNSEADTKEIKTDSGIRLPSSFVDLKSALTQDINVSEAYKRIAPNLLK